MSNEREQIESQGQKYKATPDARISRTDEGGAEPHPTYAPTLAMHLGNNLVALAWASADEYRQFRTPKTGQCL